jgi:hypothetical protein
LFSEAGRQATCNKQQAINNKQQAINNKQQATSNKATSNKQNGRFMHSDVPLSSELYHLGINK